MADEPIRAGEFNAAMAGMRDSFDNLSENMAKFIASAEARLEKLEQSNLNSVEDRIRKAREEGIAEGRTEQRVATIENKLKSISHILTALGLGVAMQFFNWLAHKLGSPK